MYPVWQDDQLLLYNPDTVYDYTFHRPIAEGWYYMNQPGLSYNDWAPKLDHYWQYVADPLEYAAAAGAGVVTSALTLNPIVGGAVGGGLVAAKIVHQAA